MNLELIAILKMLAISTAQIGPGVMAVVEVVKRFLPNKTRDVANPILAAVTGILGAYAFGGQEEVINILLQGLLAGGAAIGAYKLPKMAGAKMEIK